MILYNIDTLDQLNSFNKIVSSSSYAIPYDINIAKVIASDAHVSFRNFYKSEQTLDEFCCDLSSFPLDSLPVANTYSQYNVFSADMPVSPLYTPLSNKDFCSEVLCDVIPTLATTAYNYFISTRRIVQFGGGKGKALLYYPIDFTEEDLNYFRSNYKDIKTIINQMLKLSQYLTSVYNDISYINSRLEVKDNQILELSNKILEAQNSVNTAYQTTWR